MRLSNFTNGSITTLALLLLVQFCQVISAFIHISAGLQLLGREQISVVLESRGSRTDYITKNNRCSTPISSYSKITSSSLYLTALIDGRSDLRPAADLSHYARPTDEEEEDVRSMNLEEDEDESSSEDQNSSSNDPLARINSFLDTPILDPNNDSNQGVIIEALKEFVRDDPQLAQITFSGVVVLAILVCIRLFNAIKYG